MGLGPNRRKVSLRVRNRVRSSKGVDQAQSCANLLHEIGGIIKNLSKDASNTDIVDGADRGEFLFKQTLDFFWRSCQIFPAAFTLASAFLSSGKPNG